LFEVVHIPEQNYISFWEINYKCKDYIRKDNKGNIKLSKEMYSWLNENVSKWSVHFEFYHEYDISKIIIKFSNEEEMNSFVEKWNLND
jgi:hypothetical protein